jgi:imidazolonepropionase
MTAGEALHAATAGAAASLGLLDAGVVRAGAQCDLVAWDAEHEGAFALHLGAVRPVHVWVAGREVRPA